MRGKKTEVTNERAEHFANLAHARAKRYSMEIGALNLDYSEKTLLILLISNLLKKNVKHGYHKERMFNEFESVENMASIIEEAFFQIGEKPEGG